MFRRVGHKISFRLYLIMPFQSDKKTCLAEILGHLYQNSSSDSPLAYVVKSGVQSVIFEKIFWPTLLFSLESSSTMDSIRLGN